MAQDDTNISCSAGDPLDEARSIIDRNIARLEEDIRALKSRRNELSPISRLPVEILCIIFSLIEGIFTFGRSPESWISFSQVSQHWRSSALSAPELWNNIPLMYPRWAQEMLIRSKMAKLTIGLLFETSKPKFIETFRSCLYEMNRVEEINIAPLPSSILEEIFRDLPKSAPQLHTLCIRTPFFGYIGTAFPIHEDFLHDTDRLQCVVLVNCEISWDSRLLTGLTRLTLEDSMKADSSIIQFLHALQRMPALTDLDLKDSIPEDSEGPSTYPIVDLPCLRVLRISSGVGALTTVLRHITFPHSAVLKLTCKEARSTQIDFSDFFSVLAAKFLSYLAIRSLSLQNFSEIQDGNPSDGLEFLASATIQNFLLCSLVPPQLDLVLTWPSSAPHNYVKALTDAFYAMSPRFLTQLQISTSDYIDYQTWAKTFGKLPHLACVSVRSYATRSFFEALAYKTEAAEELKTANRHVSFPDLRIIHFEGTDFVGTSSRSISVNMLLDYLMESCERNVEIQTLRLDNCYYISADVVKRLKEIVVDVIWDGVEQATPVTPRFGSSDEDRDDDDDDDDYGNFVDDLDYEMYDASLW